MQKTLGMLVALTTLSVAHAQYASAPAQNSYPNSAQSQPAPIVQGYPGTAQNAQYSARPARSRQIFDTQPAAGVSVRSDMSNGVETITASEAVTELRVQQGRADVTIHHPADHSEILVDLPGGQVALLKDGLYTFNAGTSTVRVLHGEAEAYTGNKTDGKGTKVKEDQQLTVSPNWKLKAVDASPYELTADLLPGGAAGHGDGYGPSYGDGFYGGYPYYAGVYGYPWGYPYGYGYPFGLGVGFGYYGGFRGGFGGLRGGFRR
jgi:hypothetical protein